MTVAIWIGIGIATIAVIVLIWILVSAFLVPPTGCITDRAWARWPRYSYREPINQDSCGPIRWRPSGRWICAPQRGARIHDWFQEQPSTMLR